MQTHVYTWSWNLGVLFENARFYTSSIFRNLYEWMVLKIRTNQPRGMWTLQQLCQAKTWIMGYYSLSVEQIKDLQCVRKT